MLGPIHCFWITDESCCQGLAYFGRHVGPTSERAANGPQQLERRALFNTKAEAPALKGLTVEFDVIVHREVDQLQLRIFLFSVGARIQAI